MSRRTLATIGAVTIVSLALMGAGRPAGTVPASKWAATVCRSITTWRDDVATGASSVRDAAQAPGATPSSVVGALAGYLRSVTAATRTSGRRITKAGVPDTRQGKRAAAALAKGYSAAVKNLGRLAAEIDAMRDLPPARLAAAITPYEDPARIDTAFTPIQRGFEAMSRYDKDGRLEAAMASQPACTALQNG
ncbi:MAG: hypothetical protein U0V73_09845 [Acidimicrobiia bacterium]